MDKFIHCSSKVIWSIFEGCFQGEGLPWPICWTMSFPWVSRHWVFRWDWVWAFFWSFPFLPQIRIWSVSPWTWGKLSRKRCTWCELFYQFFLVIGHDGRLATEENVENDATTPNIWLGWDVASDIFGGSEDSPSQTLLNDLFNSEYFRDAEIFNSDRLLLFGVEEYAGKFEVGVDDALPMAMVEQS